MSDRVARVAIVVLLLGALQGVVFLVFRRVESSRSEDDAPLVYDRIEGVVALPQSPLEEEDGATVSTSAWRGAPVLVHVWATWCPPCRDELPEILALREELRDVRMILAAQDDGWPTLRAYFDGDVPAGIHRDPNRALARALGVRTLPATFLFDARGVARVRFDGARRWARVDEALLKGLLR